MVVNANDFIKEHTQKAYRVIQQTGLNTLPLQPEIHSLVYAHLLHVHAEAPPAAHALLFGKLLLLYLRFHLRPEHINQLTVSLTSPSGEIVVAEGQTKQLKAITQHCLLEKQNIILPLKDMSQAAYVITRRKEIVGCLACSLAVPDFFTQERQEIITLYRDLCALLFR